MQLPLDRMELHPGSTLTLTIRTGLGTMFALALMERLEQLSSILMELELAKELLK